MTEERVREVDAHGPVRRAARRATPGFVDGFAFDDELERATQGARRPRRAVREVRGRDARAGDVRRARRKVAILYLDGDIVDGRSQHIPLLDMKLVGSYSMADTIKQLRDDRSVRAVVLRIESPGGSSLASDVMWRELVAARRRRSRSSCRWASVAASGGYYVASAEQGHLRAAAHRHRLDRRLLRQGRRERPARRRSASPSTRTRRRRAPTPSRSSAASRDDEAHELEHKVDQFYDTFLDRVSAGPRA